MNASAPLEFAHRLAAGSYDETVMLWLQMGFQRLLSGDADSLEMALNLTGAHRVRCRNLHLRQAAHLLAAGESISDWALADRLRGAIARFNSGRLIQYRRGLPVELSNVEQHLLDATDSGARPLTSRRRLFDLLQN